MKRIFILVFLFFAFLNNANGQIDTVIDCGFYKSFFDYETLQPLQVSYKLYKGGGKCPRDKFRFKNDTRIRMSTADDYDKSGYDMGHLANAADFAFDCEKDEKTFRFYNCLPQYPNLNRGIWKKWETVIREESQLDSLLIICGGVFSNRKIKVNSQVCVPDYCWKIVYSLSKCEYVRCLWFTNSPKASFEEITIETLKNRISYDPLKYKKDP
jgi:hypothetical protein